MQVMTAAGLFTLALNSPDSAGVILNPADGDSSLPLYRPWCEDVLRLLGP